MPGGAHASWNVLETIYSYVLKLKMHISLGPAPLLLKLFPKDKPVYLQSDLCKRILCGTYFVITSVWKQLTCMSIISGLVKQIMEKST